MAYNRYINKFPTNVEFEKYIKTGIAEVPNTALIDDTGEMKYTRKLPNDYIFYGTTKGTADFMIGSSVNGGTADCIKVHVVKSTDGSDNKMYANKEDIVKAPVIIPIDAEITSIKKWKIDTSNVTNMGSMFGECSALTSLDVSSFNTSSVINMNYMFGYCSALTSLDLSGFNTSSVTDMSQMFGNCTSLTSLDVSSFNTSSVTDMSQMFGNCSGLTSLDLSSFNTSNVTEMRAMFRGCSALTSLTLSSSFFNSSVVTAFNFSSLTSWTETTSLSQFVNAISSKDGTGKTVKLSDATKTALTDAQKNSITSKGWTIA